MLELFLTACLAADPGICAERMIPVENPDCAAYGEDAARDWISQRDTLVLKSWECRTGSAGLDVTEVAPGIWVHKGRNDIPSPDNQNDLANIGFIIGDNAVAVIDAGGSRQVGEALYAAIRARTNLPIRYLFLTHMHPDHTLGSDVFLEAGATVVGHGNLDPALAARAENYTESFRRLIGESGWLGTLIPQPDTHVTEPAEFDLGNRVLVATPVQTAHTDNDLVIEDPQTGTLWVSDLVFAEHTPALDGSLRGWLQVLGDLTTHPAQRIVPGHGPVSLPWPDGADDVTQYLSALADQTRNAIAQGQSLGDVVETMGRDLQGDWLLFEEFHPRNVTAAYTELEWE